MVRHGIDGRTSHIDPIFIFHPLGNPARHSMFAFTFAVRSEGATSMSFILPHAAPNTLSILMHASLPSPPNPTIEVGDLHFLSGVLHGVNDASSCSDRFCIPTREFVEGQY